MRHKNILDNIINTNTNNVNIFLMLKKRSSLISPGLSRIDHPEGWLPICAPH